MKKSIKYNPLSAASILIAMLTYILFKDRNDGDKVPPNQFQFEPDEKADDVILGFFRGQLPKAKIDREYRVFPRNSVFRSRNIPLLFWYSSYEVNADKKQANAVDFKKAETNAVCAYIESMYGDLNDAKVRAELEKLIKTPESMQDEAIAKLVKDGSLLLASKGYKELKKAQPDPVVEDEDASEEVASRAEKILSEVTNSGEEQPKEDAMTKAAKVVDSVVEEANKVKEEPKDPIPPNANPQGPRE